jgi:hypothetical protein
LKLRILALYPNAEGYSRIPTGMAIIVILMSRAGHQLKVFDTTFMTGTNIDNSIRESAQLVKPTQADYGYENMDEQQIRESFGQTVREFDPDLLIVTDQWNSGGNGGRFIQHIETTINAMNDEGRDV